MNKFIRVYDVNARAYIRINVSNISHYCQKLRDGIPITTIVMTGGIVNTSEKISNIDAAVHYEED